MLRGKVFQGVKCSGEQSVAKEQSVLGRKVFISLSLHKLLLLVNVVATD